MTSMTDAGGYTQIQTFQLLANEQELQRSLATYERLLRQIGYDNPTLGDWLSNFTWNQLEGLGHGDVGSAQHLTVLDQKLELAPYIHGQTICKPGGVSGNWIALSLAFGTT